MAKKYKWYLTAKKVLWLSAEILIAGMLAYSTDHPEFLALVPIIEGIRNFIKHKILN